MNYMYNGTEKKTSQSYGEPLKDVDLVKHHGSHKKASKCCWSLLVTCITLKVAIISTSTNQVLEWQWIGDVPRIKEKK